MKNYDRDLLVLFREERYSDDVLQNQVEYLHQLLVTVECNETFCRAHELVTRNNITSKSKHILRAIDSYNLKPFHFLLNKN